MALDATYQPKTYRQQGGDEFVVAASGVITVESSGSVDFESGGVVDFRSGTVFQDSTVGITAANRLVFCTKKTLSGVASTAGGVGNWQAPTGSDVILTSFIYDITAASATAGCVLDIGYATTSATTKSDTLIDGLVATGSITGVKNDQKHAGTNGVGAQKMAAGKWITVTATGSKATSLAGSIYITYLVD